jgi:hypothetical protein
LSQTAISQTGRGSGMSPEEEAFQKLAASLNVLSFDPVVLCGWRAYQEWVEILSGLSLVRDGRAAGGQGPQEFIQMAKTCGWVRFELQRETINTRSGMAWQVEPRPVLLMSSIGLEPDDVRIYDVDVFRRMGAQ